MKLGKVDEVENVDVKTDVTPVETEVAPKSIEDLQGKADSQSVESEDVKEKYIPDYKFKVLDEEKEIDEYFRNFIKSKDDEQKFKDIFTKAHGLPYVKQNLDTVRSQLMREQGEKEQVVSVLQGLKKAIDEGNLEDFLESWGLDDEKIFQYAMKRIKLSENPELKAQYDASLQHRRSKDTLEQEREMLRQQNEQIMSQSYKMEYDYAMGAPQVQDFAKKFNSLPGRKQGDFENEVLKHGYFTYMNTGTDIPVSQATNEVMKNYEFMVGGYNNQVIQPKIVTQSEIQKTIPNVGSSNSSSPTKKKISRIEDLEAEANSYKFGRG